MLMNHEKQLSQLAHGRPALCDVSYAPTMSASAALLLVSGLIVLVALRTSANAQTQDPESPGVSQSDLIETAIAGLKENDERLGMIEATLHSVLENSTIKREEHIVAEGPDGTKVDYWRRPRSESRQKVTVFGEKLRAVGLPENENTAVRVRNDGIWTKLYPESKNAWIKYTEQLGGVAPTDPRDRLAPPKDRRLIDLLSEDEIIEATLTDQNPELGPDHHASGKLLARIVTQNDRGRHLVCLLDPASNFLPIFSIDRSPGETRLGSIVSNEYQMIPERSAWFLKQSIRLLYPMETNVYQFGEPGWTNRGTTDVVSYRLLDPSKNTGLFAVEIPDGIDVRDGVSKARYVIGDANDPVQGDRGSILLWAVLAAVLIIAPAIVLTWRRLRKSRVS